MASFWRPQASSSTEGIRGEGPAGGGEDNSGVNLARASNRHKHLSVAQQRALLPIQRYRREILYALEKYTTLILVGGSSLLR